MSTIDIPRLTGERLVLRPFRESDLVASTEMWSAPDTVRHVHDKPLTRGETWMKIIRFGGLWAIKGFGYWAIEEIGTGRFVGQAGFADLKRDLSPAGPRSPEAGWAIHPAFVGLGMATEAMQLALDWFDRQAGHSDCHCLIRKTNAQSFRVAEKLGFTPSGDYRLESVLVSCLVR